MWAWYQSDLCVYCFVLQLVITDHCIISLPVSPWLPSLTKGGVPSALLHVGPPSVRGNVGTMTCTFQDGSSHYCVVCCSTHPSVPPDSSVYVSSTRGTEVTVYLDGLTSGQMYYCKAVATNTTSANCGSSVFGGVKVFFRFVVPQVSSTSQEVGISPLVMIVMWTLIMVTTS